MRLNAREVEAIKSCARQFFGDKSIVRLFGSRTNDAAVGGDIDLHIEAETVESSVLRNEIAFSVALKEMIGEQRIDVILRPPSYQHQPIDRIALQTGLRLL